MSIHRQRPHPTQSTVREGWTSHRSAAWTVRASIITVPIGASIAAGAIVSRLIPRTTELPSHVARIILILAVSIVVFVAVERFARRFLPLATLLRLSLIFPDQAPSRFSIALRARNPRRLREWAFEEDQRGNTTEIGRHAEMVLSLVTMLGVHDRRTRGHSERVQALTDLMATELGLSDADAQRLRWAALLHDIGKVRVPAAILNDREKPDDEAMRTIRRHPTDGARIIEPLAAWLGEWRHAIDQHHERWDGTGYPLRLTGHEISLAGRIVAVTDAFETMTSVRSYKKAMSVRDAKAELVRDSGSHFDPEMVRCFLAISIGRLPWLTRALAGAAELPLIGVLPRAATSLLAVGALALPMVAEPADGVPTDASSTAVSAGRDEPASAPAPTSIAAAEPGSTLAPPSALPTATTPSVPAVPTPTQVVNIAIGPLGAHVPALPDSLGAAIESSLP